MFYSVEGLKLNNILINIKRLSNNQEIVKNQVKNKHFKEILRKSTTLWSVCKANVICFYRYVIKIVFHQFKIVKIFKTSYKL